MEADIHVVYIVYRLFIADVQAGVAELHQGRFCDVRPCMHETYTAEYTTYSAAQIVSPKFSHRFLCSTNRPQVGDLCVSTEHFLPELAVERRFMIGRSLANHGKCANAKECRARKTTSQSLAYCSSWRTIAYFWSYVSALCRWTTNACAPPALHTSTRLLNPPKSVCSSSSYRTYYTHHVDPSTVQRRENRKHVHA